MALLPEDAAAHYNLGTNLAIVQQLAELANENGVTPAQLALAWVHAQGKDVVPIPGTKRRRYLEDNVAAIEIQLSGDELERLDGLGKAVGDRYADMSRVNG